MWDVHRYLAIMLNGNRDRHRCHLPVRPSLGRGQFDAVACGPGTDHVAGPDPDADKRALEAAYCDPAVREPFIAALATAATVCGG